jgi:ABC-type spermidine/putrescine transport system permease subunit II
MATKDDQKTPVMQVSPEQLLALGLADVAVREAASLLRAGGYPRPTPAKCRQLTHAISTMALTMPHLVADIDATTDAQLEEAAQRLGASVVLELFGPPPGAC